MSDPNMPAAAASVVSEIVSAETVAAKLRADVVAEFVSLARKVGKTIAYLAFAAGLLAVGHFL